MHNIGIDVGLEGGISIFKHNIFVECIKMPIIKLEKGVYKRWYDNKELSDIFYNYAPANIVIEYQRPMKGQGITSMFRLGRGFGLIEGLASLKNNNIHIIDPKTWQNYLTKKYLDEEEILCFNKKSLNLERITEKITEETQKQYFNKYINLKSMSISKAKSFFIFSKIKQKQEIHFNEKDHNLIDSFLIGYYYCEKYLTDGI